MSRKLREASAEVAEIAARFWPHEAPAAIVEQAPQVEWFDQDIISRATEHCGQRFLDLLNNENKQSNGDASANDYAFAKELIRAGATREQYRRIIYEFRHREKFDKHKTYLDTTFDKAFREVQGECPFEPIPDRSPSASTPTSAEISANQTPAYSLINLADIEPETVEWMAYPYLPKKKITTMQADPGSGKTYVCCDWAARVSTGRPLPGVFDGFPEPANVLFQNGEDGLADTIVPRLISCGADLSRIRMISEEQRALTLSDTHILEAAFKEFRPALFIIDPIQQYLGSDKDMHRANEVRPVLSRVAKLCEQYGTACIIVMHMNKGEGKAMYRALGSIDFAAIARSQLLLGRNRNNPGENLIVHTKSSLAPKGPSLAFRIKGADGIEYLGETVCTEDDILKEAPAAKTDSAMADVFEMIRENVASQPTFNADLEEKVIEKGISIRTLNRAKEALIDSGEIQRCRVPGTTKWYIKRRGVEVVFTNNGPRYDDS